MKTLSLFRNLQYKELEKISLNGKILDLGGSRKSGYHELVKGEHEFVVVNYGELHPGADLNFNAEDRFPLENESYENVLAMNFLEHIFDYHNVFSETSRVLKIGGLFVAATPFMHHIHGSPDDYHRYTKSTYEKLAKKYNFEIVYMNELGYGLFSLIYQTIGGFIPTNILKLIFQKICVFIDRVLLDIPQFKKLAKNIPLGYFWVMKRK